MSMVEGLAGHHAGMRALAARSAAKSAATAQVLEMAKPVASGNGVTCSIILAEPNVYLAGFDHDGRHRHDVHVGTALLRGRLHLNVTKNVKVKAVTLKLVGKARTEWPEGIPPTKAELFEEETLRTQVLTFFNAMHDGWETNYGNQCTYALKSAAHDACGPSVSTSSFSGGASSTYLAVPGRSFFSSSSSSSNSSVVAAAAASAMSSATVMAPSERSGTSSRRLSVASMQPRYVGKDDSLVSSLQMKGYRVFHPGTFDYTFELPIDHHQLETTKLQFGSVRWELQATIERAGAFKPNLHGTREVPIVRVPDQMSLETTEPISISRRWEDQLHYDIMISGKSFPIGGRIPIAFKLTPLAKVQIHKLKVYVSETIEYWTSDRRVTRRDPGRKILLLEKSAGKPLDAAYAASELRVLAGGEMEAEQRTRARSNAERLAGRALPEPTDNILGDLDLGERYWGATEIEANVQLPTCEMMALDPELLLHPDCSWKNANVFHWIKVSVHQPQSLFASRTHPLTPPTRSSSASPAPTPTTPRAPAAATLRSASTRPLPSSTARRRTRAWASPSTATFSTAAAPLERSAPPAAAPTRPSCALTTPPPPLWSSPRYQRPPMLPEPLPRRLVRQLLITRPRPLPTPTRSAPCTSSARRRTTRLRLTRTSRHRPSRLWCPTRTTTAVS
jgi:hypothetical protein